MRKSALFACGLLLLVSVSQADSIDDAAAKKQGTTAEHVQLQNAQTQLQAAQKQIQDLQSQIKELEARLVALTAEKDSSVKAANDRATAAASELAKIKAAVSPADQIKIDKRAAIDAAINKNEIVVGMTMADVVKAAANEPFKASEDNSGLISYRAWPPGGLVYNFDMRGGIVTSVSRESYTAPPVPMVNRR